MEKIKNVLAQGTGHKRLDDDLFKAVDDKLRIYRRVGIFEIEEQPVKKKPPVYFRCHVDGCMESFTTLTAYDSHYNSNHRYTCIYCRKLLQSAHLLDLHLSEIHDNFFSVSSAKKPMFKCFIETCPIQFWNSKERNDHCLDVHKISKNFLQHYGNKTNSEKNKTKNTKSAKGLDNMSDLSMVLD